MTPFRLRNYLRSETRALHRARSITRFPALPSMTMCGSNISWSPRPGPCDRSKPPWRPAIVAASPHCCRIGRPGAVRLCWRAWDRGSGSADRAVRAPTRRWLGVAYVLEGSRLGGAHPARPHQKPRQPRGAPRHWRSSPTIQARRTGKRSSQCSIASVASRPAPRALAGAVTPSSCSSAPRMRSVLLSEIQLERIAATSRRSSALPYDKLGSEGRATRPVSIIRNQTHRDKN